MTRCILPLALCLALVSLLAPASVTAAEGWSVSASTNLVQADFISQSGSQAQLYLENNDSITPFNIPEAGAVLDALGFGGGYSQEVSWGSGAGPTVICPTGLTDLFSFCSTDTSGGWALIPDGLRTELALSASASGSRALDVQPGVRSLAYDGTVAAIGIALETLSPGPIGSNATQVASLAIQLLPEAAAFETAMERKDYTAAGFELLSLSKRAMSIIADNITDWAIGSIVDLIPGLAEVKLGIAVSKAIVVLVNLDSHLLGDNSVTTVTVGWSGGGEPAVVITPEQTPVSIPKKTPAVATPTPAQSPSIVSVSGIAPTATQTIRIEGSGFGQQAPYTGSRSFIELADVTGGWNAGWHEPGSPYSDTVTLDVVSWTDSEIVLGGFAGDYGAVFDAGGSHYNFSLISGDQIRVRVWNAQTSSGPAVFVLTVLG